MIFNNSDKENRDFLDEARIKDIQPGAEMKWKKPGILLF